MAARMMHNAEQAGKKVVQSPSARRRGREVSCGNVAYYTIVKLRNGRRSTGSSVADVHAVGTQIKGNARLTSFDEVVASDEENGGEIYLLHDVLASHEEDPATKAARSMDWDCFMAGLSKRDKAIIEHLVEGKPLSSLARRRHLNASTILRHKERLAQAIQQFMGPDIIMQIQRRPGWKDSINCTRERLACREERRSL